MTHVIFRENGNHFQFSEQGHCGGEPGHDLVCAACSTLAQTLAQGVMDCRELLKKQPVIRMEKGDVTIDALATDDGREMLSQLFRIIRRGYEAIEKKYPKSVAVGRKAGSRCAMVDFGSTEAERTRRRDGEGHAGETAHDTSERR